MSETPELLTKAEHQAIDLAGDLMHQLSLIVTAGPTRRADLRELLAPIHAIQNAILAQAAARAYPERYRLMGESTPRLAERLAL